MNARRRRALATGVGALLVAVLCAALSTNVGGGQRTVLIMVTVAWLAIAAVSVANALRTARPTAEQVPSGSPGADDDPA